MSSAHVFQPQAWRVLQASGIAKATTFVPAFNREVGDRERALQLAQITPWIVYKIRAGFIVCYSEAEMVGLGARHLWLKVTIVEASGVFTG